MDMIIRNGELITGQDRFVADIGIRDGKIQQVGRNLPASSGAEEIDAEGMYVMPGGIDVHVHLELPFCGTVSNDDFVTGTRAAAAGGVTTVIDFATQPRGGSMLQAIAARKAAADGRVAVDYSLHCCITDWDRAEPEMDQAVAEGVTTFKMFMVYKSEGWQADDPTLLQGLEATRRNGARIMVHAENDDLIQLLTRRYLNQPLPGAWGHALSRPDYTEAEAVSRAIRWAEVTGGRLYVVHLSTAAGAEEVTRARARKVDVLAETCPQYLMLDDELFKQENGHYYATCPQLRKPADQARLWEGLARDHLQAVATDTCTFDTRQKDMWNGDFRRIPFGLPGVETMLPLMHTYGVLAGRFSLDRLVQLTSVNPAKIFGMYPDKGSLAVGTDADIVVFNPRTEKTISWKDMETNCDWSPYEGLPVTGWPQVTISRGRVVAREGRFTGAEGWGRFLRRKPWGTLD